jgi:membrane protein implicated in regulation of membrane protease activity
MFFLIAFAFYVLFLVVATLVSVGFGYFLHWILPISLDTSLIISTILCSISLYLVRGVMKISDERMKAQEGEYDDDDDEEEILIPIGGIRKLKKPYITKKRKR